MLAILGYTLIVCWVVYQLAKSWYWRSVYKAQSQVSHADGRCVPGEAPKPIVGNMPDIYRAENQLTAYNGLHHKLGEIVQILWLWRYQLSVASYPMALHMLGKNQHNYEKFPPNALLRRLYGTSVLTSNGAQWKRHRLILNEFFAEKAIADYHPIILSLTQQLIDQWQAQLAQGNTAEMASAEMASAETASTEIASAEVNLCQDFQALFLDMVTQITVGDSVGALEHAADNFLQNLTCLLKASTQPQHQFVSWWRYLPLPENRRLAAALQGVDDFLEQLICQRQAVGHGQDVTGVSPGRTTVLDKLLQGATDDPDCSLTHEEIKDNLLAIIGNGYETVATTLAMTLQALSQFPDKLNRARQEVQAVMARYGQSLTPAAVKELTYVEAVLYESMRLYPAVAGIQRMSLAPDVLAGWSIPGQQGVGISLEPLHQDADYYGASPEVFLPERYLQGGDVEGNGLAGSEVGAEAKSRCPFSQLMSLGKGNARTVQLPLTFGYGARQCVAKHLALYEMKVALAMLLGTFSFEMAEPDAVQLELGKFGLFISAFPKTAVRVKISLIETIAAKQRAFSFPTLAVLKGVDNSAAVVGNGENMMVVEVAGEHRHERCQVS